MAPSDFVTLTGVVALAESPGGRPKLTAYRDSKGIWTIGHGRNLQAMKITVEQANDWLAEDLARAETEAQRYRWYGRLTVRRQQAITELLFNLGWLKFNGFEKMIAALVVEDYQTAALELLDSQWKKDVGVIRSERIAEALRNG